MPTEINVGFNTDELKSALSGGGGGNGGQQQNNIAGGFTTALKGAGIIGLLSSMKIVLDSISFVLNTISSLISFLVVKMIQGVFKFFEDPVRSLFSLFIWLGNVIIDNINGVVKAINFLIPGTGFDIPLLPNLDEETILAAYDEAKKQAELIAQGATDLTTDFVSNIIDGITTVDDAVSNGLDAVAKLFGDIAERSSRVSRGGGSSSSFSSGKSTFDNLQNFIDKQSRDPIVEQKRRDANVLLKYQTQQ